MEKGNKQRRNVEDKTNAFMNRAKRMKRGNGMKERRKMLKLHIKTQNR